MKDIFLSVVMPCYDEMANLRKGVLDRVDHFLHKKGMPYEVIIVDDGSKDGSVAFIERFISENSHFSLIKNPHFGKAGAVTTGMLAATGKFRLFTDMDQATPIEEVDKLLPDLENGEYDIVIGSRSNMRQGAPLIRLFVSRSSMTLRKVLIGMREIDDTQCGFKIFTEKSADELFTKLKSIKKGFKKIKGPAVAYGSDIELLYLAHIAGYKIKEVPVEWLFVESGRVSPLKDSIQGVRDLIKIKTNAIEGKYS